VRVWIAAGGALVVVGIVLLAVSEDVVPDAIGFTAVGAGAILLTALVFYAIGRSEDHEREREQRRHDADTRG
jgi:hypothetical protein